MNNIFMGIEPFTIKNNIGSSRQIALKYGYKTYHGAPCVEGHTEKYTSSAHCVICRKERAKWYNPKNLEKIKTDPNHVVISKNLVHSGYSLTEEQIKEKKDEMIENANNKLKTSMEKITNRADIYGYCHYYLNNAICLPSSPNLKYKEIKQPVKKETK